MTARERRSSAGWAGAGTGGDSAARCTDFSGELGGLVAVPGRMPNQILHFVGSPDVAMLMAVLVALVTLGGTFRPGRHHGREVLRKLTGGVL